MILARPEHIEQYTARGWWGRRTLDDLFREAALAHPDREAVVDAPNRLAVTDGSPRRLTWSQLAVEVARMAALLQGLGLARDDVLVQLANSVEQYIVYLAALRLGVIVSPVPVQYREFELRHVLGMTGAKAVVTSARIQRHAAAAMWCALATEAGGGGLRVLAFGAEVPAGAVSLDAAIAAWRGPGLKMRMMRVSTPW